MTGVAEERMEEEVKQDTSETETQEKRNTEECEETAEASAENTETPEDGEALRKKDKKGFFPEEKKRKGRCRKGTDQRAAG